MTDAEIEQMAKAMYEFDWPKDKWERLGPGYHQDRYKGMVRAALASAPASAVDQVDPFIVKERDLLRQAVIRYCDHSRMGTVEPPELQQVIDDAFSSRQETP